MLANDKSLDASSSRVYTPEDKYVISPLLLPSLPPPPLSFLLSTWSPLRKFCRVYLPMSMGREGKACKRKTVVEALSGYARPLKRSVSLLEVLNSHNPQSIHNSDSEVIVSVKVHQGKDDTLKVRQIKVDLPKQGILESP